HDDDERQRRKPDWRRRTAVLSMLDLRRVEFPCGSRSLANKLIVSRNVDRSRGFAPVVLAPVALAGAASRGLGADKPPQAKTKHNERRDDAEPGRGKWRRAEERHRDGVLNRRRTRQRRHGEG